MLCLQYCTCPAGYELSCPDNGTAPGCVQLPLPSKGSSTVGVVIALLLVFVAGITAWNHQLTADLCRAFLGAGNPLGKLTGFAGWVYCVGCCVCSGSRH